MKEKAFSLFICTMIAAAALFAGCGTVVSEDHYSLDQIDGDIICEYRIGKNAAFADECVDTDVVFDKDKFIELFNESNQYDPVRLSKKPKDCDLRISTKGQPEEWETISESEFNIRAVFGNDQRNVSVYRYDGRLYFHVLSMGGNKNPELEGVYFMELSEEMSNYWSTIIEAVVHTG